MNDCRTDCPLYCEAKSKIEARIGAHWNEVQNQAIAQRSQFVVKLHRLNSLGILTDGEHETLFDLMPMDSTYELWKADQDRINTLAAYAMNCSGMQYRTSAALGWVMGSGKYCPNENLWAKYL